MNRYMKKWAAALLSTVLPLILLSGCQQADRTPSPSERDDKTLLADLKADVESDDFSKIDQDLIDLAAQTVKACQNQVQLLTIRQFEDSDQEVHEGLIAFQAEEAFYQAALYQMLDGTTGAVNCEKIQKEQASYVNVGPGETSLIVSSVFTQPSKETLPPETRLIHTLTSWMVGGNHSWFTELKELISASIETGEDGTIILSLWPTDTQAYNDAMRQITPKGSLGYFNGSTKIKIEISPEGIIKTIHYGALHPDSNEYIPQATITVKPASPEEVKWVQNIYQNFDTLTAGSPLPAFPDPFV